jgi:hypothetical protein
MSLLRGGLINRFPSAIDAPQRLMFWQRMPGGKRQRFIKGVLFWRVEYLTRNPNRGDFL